MPVLLMTSSEVRSFIAGNTVRASNPETGEFAATIAYGQGDRCSAKFASGEVDTGDYGFEGDCYWTRYETFRAGKKHLFSLEKIDDSTVQAYHEDGSKAFLMSHDLSEQHA